MAGVVVPVNIVTIADVIGVDVAHEGTGCFVSIGKKGREGGNGGLPSGTCLISGRIRDYHASASIIPPDAVDFIVDESLAAVKL